MARLAEAPGPVTVVLLSSVGPLSGPYEYVKLARSLGESFPVVGFPLPGFAVGEQLPAGVEDLASAYATAMEAEGVEPPYVLAGHSSGGWVAHALATHLDEIGAPPLATVLLDTYTPWSERLRALLPMVLRGVNDVARENQGMVEARLTAMAHYSDLFAEWRPASGSFRTLLLEADGGDAAPGGGPAEEWKEIGLCDLALGVPGDHFSLMDEHSAGTARAIEQVLADLTAAMEK
jgi:thioesterase domain-containing protein